MGFDVWATKRKLLSLQLDNLHSSPGSPIDWCVMLGKPLELMELASSLENQEWWVHPGHCGGGQGFAVRSSTLTPRPSTTTALSVTAGLYFLSFIKISYYWISWKIGMEDACTCYKMQKVHKWLGKKQCSFLDPKSPCLCTSPLHTHTRAVTNSCISYFSYTVSKNNVAQ